MMALKEKIILKSKGSAYVVQSLENRIEPRVGSALNKAEIDSLLMALMLKPLEGKCNV